LSKSFITLTISSTPWTPGSRCMAGKITWKGCPLKLVYV
jgi:hypothetical protein